MCSFGMHNTILRRASGQASLAIHMGRFFTVTMRLYEEYASSPQLLTRRRAILTFGRLTGSRRTANVRP
jgi:hypothetical protein